MRRSELRTSNWPSGSRGVTRAGRIRLGVSRSGLGMSRGFRVRGSGFSGGGNGATHHGIPGEALAARVLRRFEYIRQNSGESEGEKARDGDCPGNREIERRGEVVTG